MLGTWIVLPYFVIKGAAYALWCALGVRRFRPERASVIVPALLLGSMRLMLGLGFGVVIFLASSAVFERLGEGDVFDPTAAMALTYLAVYVPVRWIEWGIVEALLHAGAGTASGFLGGATAGARRWRLGGVLVSCLADVPVMVAAGGLPVGRFMC